MNLSQVIPRVLLFIIFALSMPFCKTASPFPGEPIISLSAPGECPSGLAWGQGFLWLSDWKQARIYKIDPNSGELLQSLPSPGPSPQGLAWGTGRLFVADSQTKRIYLLNPRTGVVEKSYSAPGSSPRGLAWGNHCLWVVDDRQGLICKLNPQDGTLTGYLKAPAGKSRGLCFGGKYLWVSDRGKDEIYAVSALDGSVVVSLFAPGPFSWGLAWDGSHLWNVDFQTGRIYKLRAADDEKYSVTDWREASIELVHYIRNSGPGTLKDIKISLAVPPEKLENQQLLGPVEFSPQPQRFALDRWDQRVALYRFSELPPSETVTVAYKVKVRLGNLHYYIFPEKVGTLAQVPREIREKYLADGSRYLIHETSIQEAARDAVGGETNPYWMARRIHSFVLENVRYEGGGGWDTAPVVLARGTGSCSESTFLFIALCRASGLPARFEAGSLIRGDLASVDRDNHRWAEVYLPNYGWVPFDPSVGSGRSPADVARAVGNTKVIGGPHPGLFVTTHGGGDSEYLGWNYNSYATYKFSGTCKVEENRYFIWRPGE